MSDAVGPAPGSADASRSPAPGDLKLVQDLVNTLDLEAGEDELDRPEAAARWLRERRLLGTGERVDDRDLNALVEVREALRDLARANGGAPLPARTLETLRRHSEASPVAVRLAGRRSALVPAAPGVRGAIAVLLGVVHDATVDGTWPRVKGCRDDRCQSVFYDASRNRSSAWCSMAVCGNRAKARAFRRRRHG